MKKINLKSKFSKFSDRWSPKVIEEMNDYQFKLAKIKDNFTWHSHPDTDETFIVIEGTMGIEFENEIIELSEIWKLFGSCLFKYSFNWIG